VSQTQSRRAGLLLHPSELAADIFGCPGRHSLALFLFVAATSFFSCRRATKQEPFSTPGVSRVRRLFFCWHVNCRGGIWRWSHAEHDPAQVRSADQAKIFTHFSPLCSNRFRSLHADINILCRICVSFWAFPATGACFVLVLEGDSVLPVKVVRAHVTELSLPEHVTKCAIGRDVPATLHQAVCVGRDLDGWTFRLRKKPSVASSNRGLLNH